LVQAGGDAFVERYVAHKRLQRSDWIRGENERRARAGEELLPAEGLLSESDSADFKLSAKERKLFAAADKRWDAMWAGVRRHAVDSGLISAETAAEWAKMPYAPFLRDRGDRGGEGVGGGDPLKRRAGGEGVMMAGGEAVETAILSVFDAGTMNLAKWNVAQLRDAPGGGRWVEAASGRMEELADQTAMSDDAVAALDDIGVGGLGRVARGGFPRAGRGQMVVRQGGRDVVYEVKDADLAEAMTGVLEGAKRHGLLELTDGARKFLQRSVTWMPKFAFTQHFADLVSAQGRMPTGKFGDLDMGFKWLKPAYIDALRRGGARLDYEYNAGDFGRVMSDDARDRGWLSEGRRRRGRVKPGMSDRRTHAAFMGQQGVAHAYLQGIKNIELFTRLGAYKGAVEQGAMPAQAVLASGTATAQYRLRPKLEALQGLSFVMPFFSAALASKPGLLDVAQGGGTGAVARRAAFGVAGKTGKWAMRFGMLAGATALVDQLLSAWNESVGVEDDRPPEDFANWHVWYSGPLESDVARELVEGRGPDVEVVEMGGTTRIVVRVKKGFEVADVGSVATIGVDLAAGKLTGEQAIDRLWAVAKRAAVPVSAGLFQTAWELAANKDSFGAPVLPASQRGYGPKGQMPTNAMAAKVTEHMPADWDWAGGQYLEHAVKGVGLAGGHVSWVLDNAARALDGDFNESKFLRELFLSGGGKVRRGRAEREAWDKTKEGESNLKELQAIAKRGRGELAKRMALSIDGYFAKSAGHTANLVRLRQRRYDAGKEGESDDAVVAERYRIGVGAWTGAYKLVAHKGASRPEVALRKLDEARERGDRGALLDLGREGIAALQLAVKVREREVLDKFVNSPEHEAMMRKFDAE